jgi:hypothetical protein
LKLLKNRIFLSALCLILAAGVSFFLLPRFYESKSATIMVPRAAQDIPAGTAIQDKHLVAAEVGSYGLPEDVINDKSLIIGKIAQTDITKGGLWLAETICTLHRPSVAAQMWHQSVSDFVRELHIAEKQIHILQAPGGEFDDKVYRDMTGLSFPFELPYVKRASELQNAGTPLYFHRDRACRHYGKVLEQIADRICGGGKP